VSDNQDPNAGTDNIADLRAAADRARENEARAAAAEKKLAFIEAGIKVDEGPGKLLFDTYTGEATKDAVAAAATGYGIVAGGNTPPTPTPPAPATDPAAQAAGAVQDAVTSEPPAPPAPPSEIPTVDQAYQRFNERRAEGKSTQQASAEVIDRQINAAMSGDKSAIWKGFWTPEELAR
jgi:hypothetical protein